MYGSLVVTERRQRAAALIAQAREVVDRAGSEDSEAAARSQRMMDEADRERDEAQRMELSDAIEDRLGAVEQALERRSAGLLPGLGGGPGVLSGAGVSGPEAERAAFGAYLRRGNAGLGALETRALSATTDVEGGYLVPDAFRAQLIQDIENAVLMRRLGFVLPPIPGGTLHVPAADTEFSDASWTAEIVTAPEETAQPFGERGLTPHPLAKLVKVSRVLLRAAGLDVEAWVRQQLADKHASAEEAAFMTGNGAQRPLGIFISTARGTDVTAASATDLVMEDYMDVVGTLKAQYKPGASWILHRTIIKETRKLKDSDGQFLWQPSLQAGQPDTLLGFPVHESEYAPSSSATGLYVAALGNWKRVYWIVDSLQMSVQRLEELYAATNQVGFIGRKETDGMVVDGNGVVRLKMA